MFRCTTDRYEALYAHWLDTPGTLLDLAGFEPRHRLLDLCGGSGVVAQAALARGAPIANVLLYDLNPRCRDPHVAQRAGDVNRDARDRKYLPVPLFDRIIIRQAANYLTWNEDLVSWLHYHLEPGGKLAFNTFVHPLAGGVKPYSYRSYLWGGHRFFEAHLYVPPIFNRDSKQGTVLHLQSRLTGRPGLDISRFRHLEPEPLENLLRLRFDVAVVKNGRSLRWVCTKQRQREPE